MFKVIFHKILYVNDECFKSYVVVVLCETISYVCSWSRVWAASSFLFAAGDVLFLRCIIMKYLMALYNCGKCENLTQMMYINLSLGISRLLRLLRLGALITDGDRSGLCYMFWVCQMDA